MKILSFLITGLFLAAATTSRADDPNKQARSVHLGYEAPAGTIFYNEVTVQKVVHGSYFMACGWNRGYFGMQELANGDHVVIFSVWDDPKVHTDDPNDVAKENQAKPLFGGENVRVKRFGGEGTGWQSFFSYPWKVGETCKFLVQATPIDPTHTAYAGYFYLADKHEWKHIATFATANTGAPLSGYYSFIEDFRRDFKSAHEFRRALFGDGWVKTTGGKWQELTKARFTGDANPSPYVDAGVEGKSFYLQNGWGTKDTTKLNSLITRPPSGNQPPDVSFLDAKKTATPGAIPTPAPIATPAPIR